MRYLLVTLFGFFATMHHAFGNGKTANLPNIFWIIAEDASMQISAYGEGAIETPNIDRLAQEGVLFKNAFVSNPICSPVRSAFMTGWHPVRAGTLHHRSNRTSGNGSGNELYYDSYRLPDEIPFLPKLLKEAGYHTTLKGRGWVDGRIGKSDYNFIDYEVYYDDIDWLKDSWDRSQPLYAQFSLRGGKYREGDLPINPATPAQVNLPPHYPTHPVMIDYWKNYLNAVMIMDEQVGEILDQMEREGIADNTLVIFITDHGKTFLRGKHYLYDGGIQIPMVMRWPGKIEPGSVREDLVYGLDITATVLGAAGITLPSPSFMEGRDVFAEDHVERDRIYSSSDRRDETLDMIRSVRTDEYKYIRNFRFFKPYLQPNRYRFRYNYTRTYIEMYEQGRLYDHQARLLETPRPVEELYNIKKDPFEQHNLAGDPAYQDLVKEFREDLEQWMIENGDMGLIPEPVLEEYGKIYGSKYEAMQSPELKEQPRQVLEMMSKGLSNGRPQRTLSQYLDHEAFSVRYWAATFIARDPALSSAFKKKLEGLLDDDVHMVRIAAADALFHTSEVDAALEIISRYLGHDNLLVRYYALMVAEDHIEKVRPLEDKIRALRDDRYEYTQRLADRLVHRLEGKDIIGI